MSTTYTSSRHMNIVHLLSLCIMICMFPRTYSRKKGAVPRDIRSFTNSEYLTRDPTLLFVHVYENKILHCFANKSISPLCHKPRTTNNPESQDGRADRAKQTSL